MVFLKKIKKAYLITKAGLLPIVAKYSVAPSIEHLTLLKSIELSTIIDIGANKGQFSSIVSRLIPHSKIFAFEPLSGPSTKFKQVFSDNSNVILYQLAISDTEGEAEIHVSEKEDSSSLLSIGELQNQIFPGTKESHTETITTKRLDSILSKEQITVPALLKLDVQGFELSALKGCETLLHCFDHIYVECSFVELYEGQSLAYEVISFLQERRFILKGIYNTYYDKNGIAIQADFLFQKN